MSIVVIGLSHHNSPVGLRERFAFAGARIPAALAAIRDRGIADEAVILSTCNRVEIYAATSLETSRAFDELKRFISDAQEQPVPAGVEFYAMAEPDSVHHLFRVACGLDSMVLGETEILGQLKDAYEAALKHRHKEPRGRRTR